jgi:hypothetical protein
VTFGRRGDRRLWWRQIAAREVTSLGSATVLLHVSAPAGHLILTQIFEGEGEQVPGGAGRMLNGGRGEPQMPAVQPVISNPVTAGQQLANFPP